MQWLKSGAAMAANRHRAKFRRTHQEDVRQKKLYGLLPIPALPANHGIGAYKMSNIGTSKKADT
jgi:hypothetical protein